MNKTVNVFGRLIEYDFLSGWIKYNRIKNELSQDSLAYGICSTSYLSYFENGKKRLSSEIIEAMLRKMNITTIYGYEEIGLLRQKFANFTLFIENFDYEYATNIFNEIKSHNQMLHLSPYIMEIKVYELMYHSFVERLDYHYLQEEIELLDKIYFSMSNDLKYLYMLVTGTYVGQFKSQKKGIERLKIAYEIKQTAWINYRLGVLLCLNNQNLNAINNLLNALERYDNSGQYINALQCHSFLGMCYTSLKNYDKALQHYNALLIGTEYFNIPVNFLGVYNGLSNLYLSKKEYEESLKWSQLAMEDTKNNKSHYNTRWFKAAWNFDNLPVLGGAYYVEACMNLNQFHCCQEIFDKYLNQKYEQTKYYKYLHYFYLLIHHFNDDVFYNTIMNDILPYYENSGYVNICRKIKLKLIDYLESKRKYKEANSLYKELLNL